MDSQSQNRSEEDLSPRPPGERVRERGPTQPTRKLPDYTKTNARTLRLNSIDAEEVLWYNLRRHGLAGHKFRRQHPLGPYILTSIAHLRVWLWNWMAASIWSRTRQSKTPVPSTPGKGLRVLRFDNIQALKQTKAVLEMILAAFEAPLTLSPARGGDKIGDPQ